MPARTRADVEAQSTKDRLWESLDYSYGQQRKANDRSYDQAYSQADRQLLSRGMQRSSYGAQTLANINQQRIDSNNNIWAAQIADYQNRLKDAEDTDWQRDFQERQFAEGQRQFDVNLGFQRERAAASDNQWQQTFNYGKERDAVGDSQWQQQFDYGKKRDAVADSQWQQQFDYGKQRDAVSDQQWNMTFNYGKERDAVADSQWERQFAEGIRQNDQSTANSYLMSILSSGQMPSDEMLAAAGISKADAELIRSYYAQQIEAANAGNSGNRGGNPGNNSNNPPVSNEGTVPIIEGVTDQSLLSRLNAWYGGNVTTGKKYKTQTAEDPKSAATINRTNRSTRTISNR